MDDRLIATRAIVDLHVLYSSRSLSDYEFEERRSLDSAPITSEVMATEPDLQHALLWTATSPIPDLVISSAAKHAGLVVLHYSATSLRSRRSVVPSTDGSTLAVPFEWARPSVRMSEFSRA
jgi:hypothetical protein